VTTRADQRISFKQAAALIYRAASPSPDQVRRVAELVAHGELDGTTRGTTMDAVAAFMANSSIDRAAGVVKSAPHAGMRAANADHAKHREPLDRVYRETLKDYFLALIFRRKVSRASKTFQRAVLAGQIFILLLIAAAVVFTSRTVFTPLSPERAAVVRWLQETYPEHRVNQWHSPAAGGDGQVRMRVEFRYVPPGRRGVDTVRVFTVVDGQVVSVDSEIDGDE
jgi:hypothetical protein